MSVLIDMEMPKNCGECPLVWVENFDGDSEEVCVPLLGRNVDDNTIRPTWCPLHEVPDESDIPIFDKETRIDNCTVQILENTKTGRVSIGWWRNE